MKSMLAMGKLLSICFAVTVCLGAGPMGIECQAGQVVYDTFAGDRINTKLWNVSEQNSVLSVHDGSLHSDGPPSFSYGNIYSTRSFKGDFVFILNYKDFQTTADVFQTNCPQVSLQVMDASKANFVFLFRGECQNGPVFFANGILNGSWPTGYEASASTASGALKIARKGRTISAFYSEGAGWTKLGSFDNAFDSEVSIQVGSYTGDNGLFSVSVNSVTYSLNAVKPPDVSGCIDIRSSSLSGATVKLKQRDVPVQAAKTDVNGCYEFFNVVPGQPFTVTISGALP